MARTVAMCLACAEAFCSSALADIQVHARKRIIPGKRLVFFSSSPSSQGCRPIESAAALFLSHAIDIPVTHTHLSSLSTLAPYQSSYQAAEVCRHSYAWTARRACWSSIMSRASSRWAKCLVEWVLSLAPEPAHTHSSPAITCMRSSWHGGSMYSRTRARGTQVRQVCSRVYLLTHAVRPSSDAEHETRETGKRL